MAGDSCEEPWRADEGAEAGGEVHGRDSSSGGQLNTGLADAGGDDKEAAQGSEPAVPPAGSSDEDWLDKDGEAEWRDTRLLVSTARPEEAGAAKTSEAEAEEEALSDG